MPCPSSTEWPPELPHPLLVTLALLSLTRLLRHAREARIPHPVWVPLGSSCRKQDPPASQVSLRNCPGVTARHCPAGEEPRPRPASFTRSLAASVSPVMHLELGAAGGSPGDSWLPGRARAPGGGGQRVCRQAGRPGEGEGQQVSCGHRAVDT